MLNYIKNNCCLICEKFENRMSPIWTGDFWASFHPGCFEEMSGQEIFMQARFTKEEWLAFAGEEYCRAEHYCVEYSNGGKYWWLNGQIHREDGPAVERADGSKAWYLNGQHLTEKEFNEKRFKTST